jgi:hypothetical protein
VLSKGSGVEWRGGEWGGEKGLRVGGGRWNICNVHEHVCGGFVDGTKRGANRGADRESGRERSSHCKTLVCCWHWCARLMKREL